MDLRWNWIFNISWHVKSILCPCNETFWFIMFIVYWLSRLFLRFYTAVKSNFNSSYYFVLILQMFYLIIIFGKSILKKVFYNQFKIKFKWTLFMKFTLLAMIAHSAVQSSTRTLFTIILFIGTSAMLNIPRLILKIGRHTWR